MSTDLPARLAALRAATEAMTPGPWRARGVMIDPEVACVPHRPSMFTLGRYDDSTPEQDAKADANAAGITALRNEAIPLLDALLAEVQAARAEAVACRAVAEEAIEKLDEAASFANFGADADDIRGWADELLNDPRLATHGPAAAQAAIDEYTEAVMEACGAIDAERTPRTISARATVARLLGLPEVAR